METSTLGSEKQYKSLVVICDYVNTLSDNEQAEISYLISRLNKAINKVSEITTDNGNQSMISSISTSQYLLELIRKDFREKMNEYRKVHDEKFVRNLECYMIAKIRNAEAKLKDAKLIHSKLIKRLK